MILRAAGEGVNSVDGEAGPLVERRNVSRPAINAKVVPHRLAIRIGRRYSQPFEKQERRSHPHENGSVLVRSEKSLLWHRMCPAGKE